MFNFSRMWAVISKEFRQIARDRPTFGMIVGIPLLQILLFGYAINLDVRHISAAVVDLSHSQMARQWLASAEASQLIQLSQRYPDLEQLDQALREGQIQVGIYIPADFVRRSQDPTRPAGQILIDNTSPGIDGVARQLAQLPIADHSLNWQWESRQPAQAPGKSIAAPTPVFAVQALYNPERRTAVQIVPALIGVILNLSMVLFTAVAVVRERERGNLEFLITTPIGTGELMLGKIIPYVFIGLVQVSLILLVARLVFDVQMVGSVAQLYLAALLFIAATLSLGVLISTWAKTQFQAMQLTVFTFLPSILLSGFMFPFDGMPPIAQNIAEFLPLTHFVRLIRGISLRGAELQDMLPSLQALAIFFMVFLSLAVLRFRKRLD